MNLYRSNFLLPLFVLALSIVPVYTQSVVGGLSKDRLQRLDQYFIEKAEQGELAGGVCMIHRNGVLAHELVFGNTNVENESAMTRDQIFYIQSMTKPIISVALMTLYEEGHFSLNDPISTYLPQFSDVKVASYENGEEKLVDLETPITIAQCFSHTAGFLHGLSQEPLDKRYAQTLYGVGAIGADSLIVQPHQTIEDRVNAMSSLPLAAQPNTIWMYSASPDVLALLIEHFSGMPVDEFLQKRLFDPLGMNNTGYNLNSGQAEYQATVHLQQEGQMSVLPNQTPPNGHTVFGGTHGLFSTASDYLIFAKMLLAGGRHDDHQILSPKTIELMTSDHAKERFHSPGEGFGLGFGIRTDLADGKSLGSEGQFYWGGLFNTYFFVDPKEEMTAVFMMQFFPYTDFYNQKFRQLVYQAIVD